VLILCLRTRLGHKRWISTNTRLLSDFWPDGKTAKSYGIFRDKDGFSEKANIIIDKEQKVVFAKIYPIAQLSDFDEIIKLLEE
jgi:peroxiredoxin